MPFKTRISPCEARALPLPAGRLSVLLAEQDGIEVRWYAPTGADAQVPHDRDELYFIASGRGIFERAGERVACGPGDMLFAAAGEIHRFLDFSDDFATWVVFYGPRKS